MKFIHKIVVKSISWTIEPLISSNELQTKEQMWTMYTQSNYYLFVAVKLSFFVYILPDLITSVDLTVH